MTLICQLILAYHLDILDMMVWCNQQETIWLCPELPRIAMFGKPKKCSQTFWFAGALQVPFVGQTTLAVGEAKRARRFQALELE